MSATQKLLTDHIDIWTAADTEKKSGRGRSSGNAASVYGIKKLRELILELAVRGKLVPQDPDDEPASVLLRRIQAEKAKLVAEGKIKKDKPLAQITEEEKAYALPQGWEWTRMISCAKQITDGEHLTPQRTADVETIPLVTAKNVRDGSMDYTNTDYVDFDVAAKCWNRCKPELNDILIVSVGATIGRLTIVSDHRDMVIVRSVTLVKPLLINISYLALCLRSPLLQKFMWNGVKQNAQPCLYLAVSNSLPIPLPPLAEQHRVVAKVDELMALCDQLEAQHNNAAEAHEKLVSHLLGTLTESQRAADFSGNWQRIAAHFDTLFTTEASIDALKQTLLQLAVMGKLAPQDPKDEPASELLKRIRAKKVKMISNGKLKRQKPLPPISEEEKAFELPKNWVWCRLTEIVYILGDGLHGTPEYSNAGQYHFINGNNLIDGSIIIKPETKRVAQDQYEKYKKALAENSVLVSINGTLGNVAFFKNEEVVLGKSACYFNLHEEIDKQFVKLVIEAPCFTQYAKLHATGSTIKNLGLLAMNSLPIALPPPDEQRRIVSEMNYLMLVCDHLKSSLTDGRKLQLRLVEKFIMQAVA